MSLIPPSGIYTKDTSTQLASLSTSYSNGLPLNAGGRGANWIYLAVTVGTLAGGATAIVAQWEAQTGDGNWAPVDAETGGPAYTTAGATFSRAVTNNELIRFRAPVFGRIMRCKLKTDAGTSTVTSAVYETTP